MKKSAAPMFAGAMFNFVLFIGHAADVNMAYASFMATVISVLLLLGVMDLA